MSFRGIFNSSLVLLPSCLDKIKPSQNDSRKPFANLSRDQKISYVRTVNGTVSCSGYQLGDSLTSVIDPRWASWNL